MADYEAMLSGDPQPQQQNKYDTLLDQQAEQDQQQLNQSMAAGVQQDPNQAGEAQRIAQQTGMGDAAVQANLPAARRRAKLQDLQQRQLALTSPILARQLSDPKFAAIAHDQVDNLSTTEKLFNAVKEIPSFAGNLLKYSGGNVQALAPAFGATSQGVDTYNAYTEGENQYERGILSLKAFDQKATADDYNRIRELDKQIQTTPPPQSFLGRVLAGPAGLVGNAMPMAPKILGAGAAGAGAGAIAGAVAGEGVGAIPGALEGGKLGLEAGFAEQNAEMMVGNTYMDLIEKGVDPARARWAAGAVGAVNSALQLGLLRIAGKPLTGAASRMFSSAMGDEIAEQMVKPTVASAVKAYALNWAKNTAAGTADMTAQTLASALGEGWAEKENPFTPDLAKRLGQSAVDAALTMGTINAATGMLGFGMDASRAENAQRSSEFFNALSKNAADSEVRSRNPNAYERFIAAQAEGSGAEKIYVDGAKMGEVLNQSGLTPDEVEKVVPGLRDQVGEAWATGGDVEIPTSEYAAKLAGTPLGEAMLPHMRLDPDAMSAQEAVEFESKKKELFESLQQQAEQHMQANDEFAKSAKNVEGQVFEQLKATGTMPNDVARTNAMLMRDMIVTQAAGLGVSPEEFYEKYKPAIERATEGRFHQSELDPRSEAFRNWFGDSKIVDESGAPKVMYHGTGAEADFTAFKNRPGDIGMHFGTEGQANDRLAYQAERGKAERQRMLPVYLSIKNPLRLPDMGSWSLDNMKDQLGREGFFPSKKAEIQQLRSNAQVRDFLRAQGYDGIVYKNTGESAGSEPFRKAIAEARAKMDAVFGKGKYSYTPEEQQVPEYQAYSKAIDDYGGHLLANQEDSYVAFDPTQIKSVFNRGTFDPSDRDILKQTLPSRWPTAVNAKPSVHDPMLADLDALRQSPEQLEKAVNAIAAEPGMKSKARSVEGKLKNIVDRMTDNLLALHDLMPAEIRQRAKLWYDGAQHIAEDWGERYGKTRAQVAGVLAVLSPQRDWFQNVTLGERILDTLSTKMDHGFDEKMNASAFEMLLDDHNKPAEERENTAAYEAVKDKTLRQVVEGGDLRQMGFWLRAYDEAHNNSAYAVIHPEGDLGENATSAKGQDSNRGWGDFKTIGKAASIFMDGSPENISKQIGGMHKVRNFYNNIFDASDPRFATIDTHAVAAALWRPLSGSDKPVLDNFGGSGGSAATGVQGSYPVYFEAYKKAAEARGILPREMQSITWEAVRGLFKPRFKGDKENLKAIDDIWRQVDKGKLSPEEARQQVLEKAGGVEEPSWWKEESSPGATLRDKTYEQERPPFNGSKVTFEVAPDPNNHELTNRWRQLPQGQRWEISKSIAWNTAGKALAKLKGKAELHTQLGGYLDDTNPSLSLWLDRTVSASKALDIARVLGYALDQDSMMVTSPKKFKGGSEFGVVVVRNVSDEKAADVYNDLRANVRAEDGSPLINGHSTADGHMAILVPFDQAEMIARKVGDHLGDAHEVGNDSLYTAWPEKGEDGYGLHRQGEAGGAGSESSLREVADQLRGEAAAQLEQRIGAAEGGGILHQSEPAGTRGGFDPKRLAILLNDKADFSTFAHEAGHYYLQVLASLAKDAEEGNAPGRFKKDMKTLLDWFGVKDLDTWNKMSLEEQRPHHEAFAYNFEQYLADGKAPSLELEGVFDRFKHWLKRIYVSVRDDLNATYRKENGRDLPILSGEVRDVMDRMLASDDQIREAQAVRNMQPMFKSAAEAKMTPEEWDAYKEHLSSATQQASGELTGAKVRDMQWLSNARSRALKAMQAQHESLRNDMRAEVAGDVENEPVHAAEKFLRTGEISEGGEAKGLVAEHKLDTDAVREILAKDSEPDMDRFRGMTKKGGLHPDVAAPLLGYGDGQDLVRALRDAQPLKDAIDAKTDQAMLERYGEVATPEGMQAAVEKAVHNEARARVIAFELRHIFNMTESERTLVKAAQVTAQKLLGTKTISDLDPRTYAAREARAARQAEVAAMRGDAELAGKYKRDQLLQHAMASEAIKIKAEVEQKLRYLSKFDNPSVAVTKAIGADYMDRINELLAGYEMAKRATIGEGREDISSWVNSEYNRTGIMPAVSDSVISRLGTMHWKDMSIDQVRDLTDAVKSLEYIGRRRMQVELDGKIQSVDELIERVQNALKDVEHTTPVDVRPDLLHAKGLSKINAQWLSMKGKIRSMDAALLKMEQFFQWVDAGKDAGVREAPADGPMQSLFRLATAAEGKERAMRAESAKAMRALGDMLKANKIDLNEVLDVPELPREGRGTKWYREELIAMALNMGNDGNKDKLLGGYTWPEADAMHAINRLLSTPEMDFVQGVWNHLNTYSKDIMDLQRRQTGVTPRMVEATPLITNKKTYGGGYYPVVYDSFQDRSIEMKEAANADRLFENNYANPATSKGHTINRTGYVGPIYLSLSVIARHLDQVTHDLAWREPISDMNKVLTDERLIREIDQTYGREYAKQFRPWLQSMANDRVFNTAGDSGWENFVRQARTNATMVGLGFRLSTMLTHGGSALSNSIGEVGSKWFTKGVQQFMGVDRIQQTRDFIYERSPEMAHRMDEADRNVHEVIDEINRHQAAFTSPTAAMKTFDSARKLAFRGVSMLDMASAMPTWMGAYLKAMAHEADGGLNLGEADAVEYANRAVRNAHGGGGVKDLSAVQRDKGVMSLATMFYSYWNHVYNRQRDLGKGWGQMVSGEGKARDLPKLLARSWFYIVVPQMVHAGVHSLTQPNQNEDGSLGSFASHVAEEVGAGFVSGVPILRDLAAAAINGRDYTITPLEHAGKSIVTTIEDAYKLSQGEQPSKRAFQNAAESAGYAFGLPLAQPAATAKFFWDVCNGDADPQTLKDWWTGIMTGKMR